MKIGIITSVGDFGASKFDTALDTMLRKIAEAAKKDESEWAEKYGTDYENDVFMMHTYCWCDDDNCPWCKVCKVNDDLCIVEDSGERSICEGCEQTSAMPNFWYKPTNFRIWWYKYIGRSVEINRVLTEQELAEIEKHCLGSLKRRREDD